jgi:hypothetical protein
MHRIEILSVGTVGNDSRLLADDGCEDRPYKRRGANIASIYKVCKLTNNVVSAAVSTGLIKW